MAKKEEDSRQVRRRREQRARKNLTDKPREDAVRPHRRGVLAGLASSFLAPALLPGDSDDALDAGINSPGYVSVNEGVRIYRQLEREIKTKAAMAKKSGKKLRVFLLEQHIRPDVLAYEMMALHIAKALGIKEYYSELSDSDLKEYLAAQLETLDADPSKPKEYKLKKAQYFLHRAQEMGFEMHSMDNFYPGAGAMLADMDKMTMRSALDAVPKRFDVTSLKVTVESHSADHVNMDVEGLFRPPLNDKGRQEIDAILKRSRVYAQDQVTANRESVMLDTLRKSGDCLVVVGKMHGRGLVQPLRDENMMDVTFHFGDAQSLREDREAAADPLFAGKKRQEILWMLNPANAIQCAGSCLSENFDPAKIPVFVERVIEKANSTGLGRE